MIKSVFLVLGFGAIMVLAARGVGAVSPTVSPSPVVSAVEQTIQVRPIDYALPYPGVLPDSPIYFLKVWRDQIVSFLIQSPVKKSFYLLLLSDKRLAAGEVLIDTGKVSLGVTTIVNGEDYFSKAVDQAEKAKNEKRDVADLLAKLTVASSKHEEVIGNLSAKVTGTDAPRLAKAYTESQTLRSRVTQLSLTK